MKSYQIDEKDLVKFRSICASLNKLVNKIKKYEPSAHLYATPAQLNLMVGYGICVGTKNEICGDEQVYDTCSINTLDCGDW